MPTQKLIFTDVTIGIILVSVVLLGTNDCFVVRALKLKHVDPSLIEVCV